MVVGCPSCGAPVAFRAGASVVVVCEQCKFAVHRTDRDVRLVGRVADLALTDSSFTLGMRGSFRGVAYEIIGRQQLDHGQGAWDEWYLAFSDGRWGWVAEAQGRIYLTFATSPPAVAFDQLAPGGAIFIGESRYVVAEKGTGRVVSAQGELPTAIAPGGWFRYVDLSGDGAGGSSFATLDYGEGATPEEAYVGAIVSLDELGPPADARGGIAPAGPGLTDAQRADGREGGALRCPSCGGNLEIRAPGVTRRVACPYCNSLLDASQGALRWLEVLEQQATTPLIPIGAKGRLDAVVPETHETGAPPVEWIVIGYMTRECHVEGSMYSWDEYLLYAQGHGFRFLMEQDGHWNVIVPVEAGAVTEASGRAVWRGVTFRRFSEVEAQVVRVLGELYWAVRAGERAIATDYVFPARGLVLSREVEHEGGREEISWSLGHYVDPVALFRAFGVTKAPPQPRGIAPNQPSTAAKSAKGVALVALALLAVWIVVLVGMVATAKDEVVFRDTISLPLPHAAAGGAEAAEPGEPAPEPAYFSEPFPIDGRNVEVTVATSIASSYLWVGAALIHDGTGEVRELEVEASAYSGVDDGEAWSEGSPTQHATVSGLTPGTYVLRLQPAAERGSDCDTGNKRCAHSFTVQLRGDTPILWPGFVALAFILLVPIIAFTRIGAFEARRWAESNVRNAAQGSAE